MDNFRQQLLIAATPAAVYQALATQAGLRGWWTETCTANAKVGGLATFEFGQVRKVMRIEKLDPNREVRWSCLEADIAGHGLRRGDEWVGTEMVFKLTPQGDSTRLDFEHIGLTPALECYQLCNDGWTHFMNSLRRLAEDGRGTPFRAAGICEASRAGAALEA